MVPPFATKQQTEKRPWEGQGFVMNVSTQIFSERTPPGTPAALGTIDLDVANSIANATGQSVDTGQDANGDRPEVDYSRLKFLVVDDSRFCRSMIKNALAIYRIGNVLEADDAAEAISTLQAVAVDFVLVDYEMPGFDGVEFTRRIRWSEEDALDPKIPIIMISCHTEV